MDFFVLPRFKHRICTEELPLLSNSKEKWLKDIKKVAESQIAKKRAILVICESIGAVEDIRKAIDEVSSTKASNKVHSYHSSFDKDFEKNLTPLDIVIATNLAGRGTDFKISRELEENGGLHVVLGYMPPNARVEAQAEGRTARAGQPGSYQVIRVDFINCFAPYSDLMCLAQNFTPVKSFSKVE